MTPPFCQPCSSRFGSLRRLPKDAVHNTWMTSDEVRMEWAHIEDGYFGDLAVQLRARRAFGGQMLASLGDHGPLWAKQYEPDAP